jgi:hypothetical protein
VAHAVLEIESTAGEDDLVRVSLPPGARWRRSSFVRLRGDSITVPQRGGDPETGAEKELNDVIALDSKGKKGLAEHMRDSRVS